MAIVWVVVLGLNLQGLDFVDLISLNWYGTEQLCRDEGMPLFRRALQQADVAIVAPRAYLTCTREWRRVDQYDPDPPPAPRALIK